MHLADELIAEITEFVRGRTDLVVNSGLSVSGLQHVGRLRGEIVLGDTIARAMREGGHRVVHGLVLYTQDQWKASPRQVAEFTDGSGAKYASWRLIDIPAPPRCHPGLVDHHWDDLSSH